jgi:hypothetical protein
MRHSAASRYYRLSGRKSAEFNVEAPSMKTFASLLFALLLTTSEASWSCHASRDPMLGVNKASNLERFELIYIGRVVGVRLSSTIAQLEEAAESKEEQLGLVEVVGGTNPFEFEVYPDQILKGAVAEPQMAVAGGCDVELPKLMESVIVFRRADGNSQYRYIEDVGAAYIERVVACVSGVCEIGEQR